MKFGSVCSGIEAASVALHPLGWQAAWLAEIEPFPSAVLAHHYPDVPNLGDMTTLPGMVLRGEIEAPDVLIGGTPCQAFSVAGMRRGMADPRGLLTIRFVELADAIDHVRAAAGLDAGIVWWENVPGVLSDKENAFGCFLAALVGESDPLQPSGGRWTDAGAVYGPKRNAAWRILDAQYFGLAQRRRRVFVVASAGDGFDPGAVLFESGGVRRHPPARGEAGQGAARGAGDGAAGGRGWPADVACTLNAVFGDKQGLEDQHALGGGNCSFLPDIAGCLLARDAKGADSDTKPGHLIPVIGGGFDVAHTLKAEGFDASEDGTGRGTPLVPVAFDTTQITSKANYSNPQPGDPCHPLAAGAHPPAIAFSCKDHGADAGEVSPTLRSMGHDGSHANGGGQVAVAFHHNAQAAQLPTPDTDTDISASLTCSQQAAVAFAQNQRNEVRTMDVAGALAAEPGAKQQTYAMTGMAVRRLTPRECEALQGFKPDYTRIPWRNKPAEDCPDGPRYKALGNSMAVPCMAWIGMRISLALRDLEAAA